MLPHSDHRSGRNTHDPQRRQRPNNPKRHRRKHDERLDRVLELEHQRHEDQHHRNFNFGRAAFMTSDASLPSDGIAETVMVRN